MRDEYEFSKANRADEIPHLVKLQREAKGKTRITILLDSDVLATFRARAEAEGIGVDEQTLRRVLREELKAP